MVRRKRYKSARRKKRKPKGRAGLFFLLVLLVMGIVIFYGYRRLTDGLAAQADYFMERVAAGDRAGAGELLAENGRQLNELISLFADPEIEYAGIGAVRLSGVVGGWADVEIKIGESTMHVSLFMVRRGWQWQVLELPEMVTVTGAFVLEEKEAGLRLFWDGQEREVRLPRTSGLEFGAAVRVSLVEDTAVSVKPLDKLVLSRLIRRGAGELEGELEGVFPVGETVHVYTVGQNRVAGGRIQDLVIGRRNINLYSYEGDIVAAVLEGDYEPQTIRVVLRQNLDDLGSESLRHRWLRLSGDAPVLLEDRVGGTRHEFPAGLSLLVEPVEDGIRVASVGDTELIFHNRIWFSAGSGLISVAGLQRAGWDDSPAFRGSLDVSEQGGNLLAVNEPTLEEYLYTVVPSEMPPAFGPEPLKAQAVAARTYAYTSIFSGRFSDYGAHVDDSVLSQVYNNNPGYPRSSEAVDATAGIVLFFDGSVADTRFFSTSSGYTAGYHEVWSDPDTGNFPAEPVPYLQASSQIPGENVPLQTETQVQAFLQRRDWPAFDLDAPFFRWQVEMSAEELAASINHNLALRHREQPDFILTLENDLFQSVEIPRNPLGELLDIRVVQRGAGGNMIILEVEGTNGTYRILKEYNIRFTLRPVQYLEGAPAVELVRNDGSVLNNYSILPSAFVFFDRQRDEDGRFAKVIMYGGGNGHGVGMSQYGARGMALQGYDYLEILEHFYPGTEALDIYPD